MISIDTNILARILVDDKNVEQMKAARKLATSTKELFITQIVQVELVWVLKGAFQLTKADILFVLHELYENDAFLLQYSDLFLTALKLYESSNIDFSDCLILANTRSAGNSTLYTFDQKFAKLDDVKLLKV